MSTAIDDIIADVKGGVNYKGHLKFTDNAVNGRQLDLSTYISALYARGGMASNDILNLKLNNGWMYYSDF